jgi:hypothetical protein
MATATKAQLQEQIAQRDATLELFEERLVELELALDDEGWMDLELAGEREFSRDGLARIIRLARLAYLKNPLINRAVSIGAHYVFGQGINIQAAREPVNDVIQAFWDDRTNGKALTKQQALVMKETELEVTGNVLMALFPSRVTGAVKVRSIPIEEVTEVIKNPDDAMEPWFYRRIWRERVLNQGNGQTEIRERKALYPDWAYRPTMRRPAIGDLPVHWESPMYHVKVGGFESWSFGVPEVYSALDWAKAVKEDLEDYLTIRRALARFVWRLKTPGGARGVAAARTKLGTTVGVADPYESNPPPAAGSVFIGAEGVDMEPIRTAGAVPSLNDGRRVGLMVSAGTGIPETMLFGDADVGNLATAKTLDRPTELQMLNRQSLWRDVFSDLFTFVIDSSVRATRGKLAGKLLRDPLTGDELIVLATDTANDDPELRGEPMDRAVGIDYPAILERDVKERITAITSAATLDGKERAGTMDDKTLVRLLLTALGEDDVDELVAAIVPEDGEPGEGQTPDQQFAEAVRELREAVRGIFPAAA